MPEKPLAPYLKPDENLKGGVTSLYLSDTLLRVTGGAKLEKDKEFGIKGSRSEIQVIKSRSNEAGKKIPVIFNQSRGFSDALTNYNFLKAQKLVSGAGKSFYLNNLPDVKFAQNKFEELYHENEEVREAVLELLYSDKIIDSLVPDVSFDPTSETELPEDFEEVFEE